MRNLVAIVINTFISKDVEVVLTIFSILSMCYFYLWSTIDLIVMMTQTFLLEVVVFK